MRSKAAVLVVGAVLFAACSPAASDAGSGGAAGVGSGAGAVGGAAGMGGGGVGGGVPTGPCLTFETAPCGCGSLPGRSVCTNGTWLACECAGAIGGGGNGANGQEPPGNKRADLMWNWTATMPSGSCRPGHYEGNFDGFYASSLTAIGFPIPVMGVDLSGMPPLEFDLVAGTGGGEILVVSGGKMRGTANGLFPFAFDIVGSLDCATLKFEAELVNGYYEAFGARIMIAGPLVSDYDPVTASMVNGKWIVSEPGSPPVPAGPMRTVPWYGGDGAWHAMFVRP